MPLATWNARPARRLPVGARVERAAPRREWPGSAYLQPGSALSKPARQSGWARKRRHACAADRAAPLPGGLTAMRRLSARTSGFRAGWRYGPGRGFGYAPIAHARAGRGVVGGLGLRSPGASPRLSRQARPFHCLPSEARQHITNTVINVKKNMLVQVWGSSSVNSAPSPGTLATVRSPPIARARNREM